MISAPGRDSLREPPLELLLKRLLQAEDVGQKWSEATAAWLRSHRSASTRRAYIGDLVRFLKWLSANGRGPQKAGLRDITDYFSSLRVTPSPLSSATQARMWSSLVSWYDRLQKDGLVSGNPVASYPRPHIAHRSEIGVRTEDINAILRVAEMERREHARRNRALVGMLAELGLTVSEVIGLDVKDVYSQGGQQILVVQGRGERVRKLLLPAELGRHLHKYLVGRQLAADTDAEWRALAAGQLRVEHLQHEGRRTVRGVVTGPLFVTRSGRRLTQAAIFAVVRRLAEAAGLSTARISPRSLRRAVIAEPLK